MFFSMDNEALISAVYVRRPVWDKKHKLHCNRGIIERCWRDISAEMDEDEFKLRKRWKYLRDQFAVELGKIVSAEQAGNCAVSKWPYFNLLSFMRDIVKPRFNSKSSNTNDGFYETPDQLESSAKSPEAILGYSIDPDTSSSLQEIGYQEYALTEDNVSDRDATEFVTVTSKKRKHGEVDPFECSIPEVQYVQTIGRNEHADDVDEEHLCFFKSLIPHIKKIPPSQILAFRSRINELVEFYAYVESNESSNTQLSTDSNHSARNRPSTSRS